MSLSAATPRAPDLCGRTLDGRYELHALIGEGAFGCVYRGRDRRLAREVAVKVIKPWWAEDRDWVRNFEREAQLMASVSDPGIVQIFDVGEAEEGLYYVAELVEGESVAARLRRGPLAPEEARDLAEQLSRALAVGHAQHVVHRDIKPANVLISSGRRVKVTDFGVAALFSGGGSGHGAVTLVGTPRYMAPEQARGRGTGPASDVYSVGVVLYEMLTGQPPFHGGSPVELALAHLQDPPPPLPSSVPGSLAAVVERALLKDPHLRYRSGAELADALAGTRRSTSNPPPAGISRTADSDRGSASERVAPTLVAPWMSPRRNVNPAARRRTVAAFSVVLLVLLGMVGAVIALGGANRIRVADLNGLGRAAITARLARGHLHAAFRSRYSSAPVQTAIAQSPAPGAQVTMGSIVTVTLSAGPPPVAVPRVVGFSSGDAQSTLLQLGLHASVTEVPAPGMTAGTVTAQAPSAGVKESPGTAISLSVAEPPRWRTVLSFTDRAGRASPPFRIRGIRWRVVYGMGYSGTCTFIFICSGPTAQITNVDRATTVSTFDLGEGSDLIRSFNSGPGVFQVRITPGDDSTRWSAEVQDYY